MIELTGYQIFDRIYSGTRTRTGTSDGICNIIADRLINSIDNNIIKQTITHEQV